MAISSSELPLSALLLHLCSSSAGEHVLLLRVSCSALLVASVTALLIHLKPALLLAFSLVVYEFHVGWETNSKEAIICIF